VTFPQFSQANISWTINIIKWFWSWRFASM